MGNQCLETGLTELDANTEVGTIESSDELPAEIVPACTPWPGGRCLVHDQDYVYGQDYYGKYAKCRRNKVYYNRKVSPWTTFTIDESLAERCSKVFNRVKSLFVATPQAQLDLGLTNHLQRKMLFQPRDDDNLLMLTHEANKYVERSAKVIPADDQAVSIGRAMLRTRGEIIVAQWLSRTDFHIPHNYKRAMVSSSIAMFVTYLACSGRLNAVPLIVGRIDDITRSAFRGISLGLSTLIQQQTLLPSSVPSLNGTYATIPPLIACTCSVCTTLLSR